MLLCKRLNDKAILPRRANDDAAGLDLFAIYRRVVAPGERVLINTGWAIQPSDPHVYLRVAPRSGLALKNGIDVQAGVIDRDYDGQVGVVLLNTGQEAFAVEPGMRVAQLIPERYVQGAAVSEVTDLPRQRGGGFGSTGV